MLPARCLYCFDPRHSRIEQRRQMHSARHTHRCHLQLIFPGIDKRLVYAIRIPNIAKPDRLADAMAAPPRGEPADTDICTENRLSPEQDDLRILHRKTA